MLDRKKEILELLSEEQYITAQEIGKRLAVSEKTVRTRLHETMDAVAEYGAQILSEPRYGYCLRVVDAERWNGWMPHGASGKENCNEGDLYNKGTGGFIHNREMDRFFCAVNGSRRKNGLVFCTEQEKPAHKCVLAFLVSE